MLCHLYLMLSSVLLLLLLINTNGVNILRRHAGLCQNQLDTDNQKQLWCRVAVIYMFGSSMTKWQMHLCILFRCIVKTLCEQCGVSMSEGHNGCCCLFTGRCNLAVCLLLRTIGLGRLDWPSSYLMTMVSDS